MGVPRAILNVYLFLFSCYANGSLLCPCVGPLVWMSHRDLEWMFIDINTIGRPRPYLVACVSRPVCQVWCSVPPTTYYEGVSHARPTLALTGKTVRLDAMVGGTLAP